jgi:predicted lipoprotein with Yx(FWY)xxD motif
MVEPFRTQEDLMPTKTLAAVAALALVVAGTAAAAHRHHSARHSGGTLVELHKTSLGKVLATSKGLTLYLYTPDPKGKSVCKGSCAAVWPPLLTKGKPQAGKGLKKSLLGTTKRGGKRQVTYAGHPLYHYTGDSKAGQVNGEAYGGTWYAVNAAGKKVPKKTGGTSGGGGGGGYGGY